MEPVVTASLIAAVPAGIAAVASVRSAWRSARTHKEVQTGNGMPLGETVVAIKQELRGLRADFNEHRLDDDRRFQEIKDALDE